MPLGQSWTYRGVPFGARIQPELVPVADHTQPRKKGSKRPATAAAVADDRPGDGAASAGSGPATHDESVDGRPAAGETSEATPGSAARATPFPVVGIGASAGGLAAFEAFFAATAAGDETGMAFVLVQHLSPDHKSMLVDLVKRCTRMQVFEASNGMVVQPNCTYIIPPNHDLELVQGVLLIKQHDRQRKPRLTIDHFFTSLAAAQGERAICVVMSGTGNDGTLGLRDVKGEGGLVIAQDPDSAEYDGMPRSAIATGMVDYVLTPAAMPGQLLRYVRHAFDAARPLATSATRDGFLKKLCVLLRAQTGHDFSQYKETTLLRRMERRMALHQIAQAEDYLRLARDNAQELEALFRDLLIGVTNFFRDPTAFKVLEETVIPRMLSERALQDPLRVWVCGCSTGEEAYSIAILLHERMLATKRTQKVQLFATDIDRQAIEQARDGVYPASIAANVSEQRLGLYFTHDPQRATYRIQKHLRDLVVFSEQDVIKDPPFSRLDLVSCRNLLIYLNPDLQRRLMTMFHYALAPNGTLFLGTSETVGDSARLFQVVDRKWKIYTRLAGDKLAPLAALPDLIPPPSPARAPHAAREVADSRGDSQSLRQLTERALLAHSNKAGVMVDARGRILHIVGRTGKYLEPAAGDASMNILEMARDGLRRELTVALHRAVAHREPVSYGGLWVKANGEPIKANLAVQPIELAVGAVSYLVVLEEVPAPPGTAQVQAAELGDSGRIEELERELRTKDEYLQTTLEEMETTNEELKSTNEEMQSINEELQSTNEELETSKEELQSVNEELATVNAELQDKVADLSHANNDMNNLLAGTGVGTVFVDHQLRISRFTPAATQVINFIDADIGRPLGHVTTNLVNYDRLIDDVQAVFDNNLSREVEVQTKSGDWYLMRIRRYRTIDNVMEGVVITLVDITQRKRTEESLRGSEERLNAYINQAAAGVSEVSLDGRFTFVNDRLCATLGYTRDELLTMRVADVTDPQDMPRLLPLFKAIVGGGPDVQIDKRYLRRDGSQVPTHERVSAIRGANGVPTSLLLLSLDPIAMPSLGDWAAATSR
jgi:two-component system CheB/CheR fusion protein